MKKQQPTFGKTTVIHQETAMSIVNPTIKARMLAVAAPFIFASLALASNMTPTGPGATHAQRPVELPAGLSLDDWESIKKEVAAEPYRARRYPAGGFVSSNRAHGWQIRYGDDGVTTLTPADQQVQPYRLAMKLSAVGYRTLSTLERPLSIQVQASGVGYQWSENLREWWVNSPTDLEQWFSLQQKPAGGQAGDWLRLRLQLDSDLTAETHGDGLRFSNGSTAITYTGLKVWDAHGKRLSARMQRLDQGLELLIDDQNALYPITIDPSFVQQAYLKASNTGQLDRFGYSVAVSGDTVVVGARDEDSNAIGVDGDQNDNQLSDSGAAYVFVRSGATWTQQAYLKASNTGSGDKFGSSVAVSGNTVVVGAPFERSNATGINGDQNIDFANEAGAAYVFTRSGATWSQQAYLKASNTGLGDWFGWSVAVSGDTVVVGARKEGSNATGINGNELNNFASGAGAAYVFTRSGATWTQQAYLKASNTGSSDFFGSPVAIDGDTVVVGAATEDSNATGVNGNQFNNFASNSGAAYVFARSGITWTQQAYLKASNTDAGDLFGWSAAVSGNTVVVGAPVEGSNATGVNTDQFNNLADYAGAAYVFVRSGASWSQQAYLKASNTDPFDQFGNSVAVSGDTVLVGAFLEESNAAGANGDQTNNGASNAGAAYVFARSGASWSQQAYLKASNPGAGDNFGFSVALSNDILVLGAELESSNATDVNGNQSDNSRFWAGAAYALAMVPSADLAVSKTDAQQVVADGDPITYMISVTNNGPDDVIAATVQDLIPAELSQATWQCIADAGASCTSAGIDDIADTVNLQVGSSANYLLTVAVDPDFLGMISNTATVTAPAGITDLITANNTATDTTLTDGIFSDGFEEPLAIVKRWLEKILQESGN